MLGFGLDLAHMASRPRVSAGPEHSLGMQVPGPHFIATQFNKSPQRTRIYAEFYDLSKTGKWLFFHLQPALDLSLEPAPEA